MTRPKNKNKSKPKAKQKWYHTIRLQVDQKY